MRPLAEAPAAIRPSVFGSGWRHTHHLVCGEGSQAAEELFATSLDEAEAGNFGGPASSCRHSATLASLLAFGGVQGRRRTCRPAPKQRRCAGFWRHSRARTRNRSASVSSTATAPRQVADLAGRRPFDAGAAITTCDGAKQASKQPAKRQERPDHAQCPCSLVDFAPRPAQQGYRPALTPSHLVGGGSLDGAGGRNRSQRPKTCGEACWPSSNELAAAA
ncbi:uncharacterized protein PSFLO_00283 [Pseudozyma flocculosa]|uniref:Uncharacterized protein n=1 Tax=Pseudozyma flocculosa TaxID=84751 RepID=A0A5C3ERT5_9BASI|nr:uncharacterized protein PSFLO_00283 [Pseudozyma flocculosa]